MTESISFIHAADLHIDSPFKGLTDIPDSIFSSIRNSTFQALDNLVKTAIERQVDFVLISGDLFDSENQSVKAQVYVRRAFEKLKNHEITVYLSYGNHDYINRSTHSITYPDNVFIFPDENVSSFLFEKDNKKIASIYGFSYENRSVMTNKSIEYQVKDHSIPFHIAMLHGSIHGNEEHDTYAPFNLNDLKEQPFDYWALGHIHKREILSHSPPIVYPGNIQGRHRKETGEKGCYYVHLSESDMHLEFVSLQSIIFQEVTVDVSTAKSIYDVEEIVNETVKMEECEKLIHLTFYSNTSHVLTFNNDHLLDDLISLLNESLVLGSPWGYIYAYQVKVEEDSLFDYDDFFIGEIIRSFDELDVSETLRDLYHHPNARKFLDGVAPNELKNAAKQFLIHELLKVEEGE